MRLMGLDVGDKRVGVALSDELGICAQPVAVIQRTDSIKKDIAQIRKIIEENDVSTIIIGMPLMLNGSVGVQAEKVEAFAEALRRRVKTPIIMWDERLTTNEVERILISDNQSRAKRKEVIDKMAAAVILGSYLDSQRSGVKKDCNDWEE